MSAITNEHIITIDIEGKLNGETAVALEANLNSLIANGKKRVILDCKQMTFVTSYGISFLLLWSSKMNKEGGTLVLCGINREITSLFSILKIAKFIAVYPDKNQAIEAIKGSLFKQSPAPSYRDQDLVRSEEPVINIDSQDILDFPSPLVIECATCSALVRVYRPGDYICPGCKTEFHIKQDGTAIF
ncbi:MAG: STAS domain-containing protein [Spirochaetes bacterium]|nr:STAS domain-containing protein [Spirochaetota bacterium]MBN2771433.1 STAS domain-containing protein [Spirochaetota bacterium]